MRTKFIALVAVASVTALACGDGGTGSTRRVTPSTVPDDSYVPDSSVVPNDADFPTHAGTPTGGPAPGNPPGSGSIGSNCGRLCAHELRVTCELDLPEQNCASTCATAVSNTRCAAELTSALVCILDAGACPEEFDESDPAAQFCSSLLQRYAQCTDTGDEPEAEETLD